MMLWTVIFKTLEIDSGLFSQVVRIIQCDLHINDLIHREKNKNMFPQAKNRFTSFFISIPHKIAKSQINLPQMISVPCFCHDQFHPSLNHSSARHVPIRSPLEAEALNCTQSPGMSAVSH